MKINHSEQRISKYWIFGIEFKKIVKTNYCFKTDNVRYPEILKIVTMTRYIGFLWIEKVELTEEGTKYYDCVRQNK